MAPGRRHRTHASQCDAVCVSHGFTPRLELAIAAGCAAQPRTDSSRSTTANGPACRRCSPPARSPASAVSISRWPKVQIAGRLRRRRSTHRRRNCRGRRASPVRCSAVRAAGSPTRTVSGPGWTDWLSRRHHRLPLRRGRLRPLLAVRRGHRVGQTALGEADHPRRARHLPGPDLRPHRRTASWPTDGAGFDRRRQHRSPPHRRAHPARRTVPAPEPRRRRPVNNSIRKEIAMTDIQHLDLGGVVVATALAFKRGPTRRRPVSPSTTTSSPSTATG